MLVVKSWKLPSPNAVGKHVATLVSMNRITGRHLINSGKSLSYAMLPHDANRTERKGRKEEKRKCPQNRVCLRVVILMIGIASATSHSPEERIRHVDS